MSVAVVVPVKDRLDQTQALAACLAAQSVPPRRVICLDDGSKSDTKRWLLSEPGWEREDTDGLTIYEAWNRGFWLAGRTDPCDHVLIVNNDVLLPPHALEALSAALAADETRVASYPDWRAKWSDRRVRVPSGGMAVAETRGVWGSDGMLGYCFLLARERVTWRPLVQDLTYKWWYGDNHLARSMELAGLKQVKVLGLPIHHVQEATAGAFDLAEAKTEDRIHWETVLQLQVRTRPMPRGTRLVHRREWRQRPPGS